MRPGDAYALNNPYNGGTHLPDVTVVMPIFHEGELLFFSASRAHHADIGGITPGSMPPDSTHIDEEGVLFDNMHLVADGQLREKELMDLLTSGKWPARNPQQNVADIQAQIASCQRGANELHRMVQQFGQATVRAYMQHVQDNAEESVRRVLDRLDEGSFTYAHDLGPVITVKISIDKKERRARIDFTGTSPQQPWNFNAPGGRDTGGRALCLPHAGRLRHPDERGLHEAFGPRDPGRLDPRTANIRPPSAPAMSRPRNGPPTRSSARSR